MPRRYHDGYEAPPDDRIGGVIPIFLLGIAVVALALGAGWFSIEAVSRARRESAAVAAPTVVPTVVPTRLATVQPIAPSPMALPVTVPDWDIPSGHFYTQTSGEQQTSARGFAVTNAAGIPFWDEFQRLGGVPAAGYPLTGRFSWRGLTTQVLQRAILQWHPSRRLVQVVNIMDELHDSDKDQWLFEKNGTPPPLPPDFDRDKSFEEVKKARMAILTGDPAMVAFLAALPDSLALFGLPASQITDMGDNFALRFQRGVLQRWKVARPWARLGEVTAGNSGELAVAAGLFPPEALEPQSP